MVIIYSYFLFIQISESLNWQIQIIHTHTMVIEQNNINQVKQRLKKSNIILKHEIEQY